MTRFVIRNVSIRNMRLKLGRNQRTVKKNKLVEFQVMTCKNRFTSKFLVKLEEEWKHYLLPASKKLSMLFLYDNCLIWVVIGTGSL